MRFPCAFPVSLLLSTQNLNFIQYMHLADDNHVLRQTEKRIMTPASITWVYSSVLNRILKALGTKIDDLAKSLKYFNRKFVAERPSLFRMLLDGRK